MLMTVGLATSGCDVVAGLDGLDGRDGPPASGVVWAQRFGGAAEQAATAVAVDGDANIVVAGVFSGTLTFGDLTLTSTSARDIFVAKLSPDGTPMWARRFECLVTNAADPSCRMSAIAVDSREQIVVVGSFWIELHAAGRVLPSRGDGADAFLVMLAPDGSYVWGTSAGDAQNQSFDAVAIDDDDTIVLAGPYDGFMKFYEGLGPTWVANLDGIDGTDGFVARYLPNGAFAGARAIAGLGGQRATALAVDGSDILVAGTTAGAVDLGGQTLVSHGFADMFLARFDATLSPIWSTTFGDAQDNCFGECQAALAVDDAHRVLMAGSFTGTADFGGGPLAASVAPDAYVARFQQFGQDGAPRHDWSSRYGDPFEQRSYGAAVAEGHDLVVAGLFAGSIDFGQGALVDDDWGKDVFVARFDASGAPVWARALRNTTPLPDDVGRDRFYGPAVAVDPAGAIVVAGSFSGKLDVGDGVLSTGAGDDGYDLFVVKLEP